MLQSLCQDEYTFRYILRIQCYPQPAYSCTAAILHSIDILLVCMCVRVSASARLVTFFIIILCGGTCVHLHLHTVRESYYCHLIKNAFCHCSLIISSHVPVNENMKYLS